MRNINLFAVLFALGCSSVDNGDLFEDPPADAGPELGQTAQATSLMTEAAATGNAQVFGTNISGGQVRSCTRQQPADTTCYVTRGISSATLRWVSLGMGNGWHQGNLPYANGALGQIMANMDANSVVQNGSWGVSFFAPDPGTQPIIRFENVDLPTTQTTTIGTFVRVVPGGTITTMDEVAGSSLPGTWKSATKCFVHIDWADMSTKVVAALAAAGEQNANLEGLTKQAMAFGILGCLGVGQTNNAVQTNNMQYSHRAFTRNVYNSPRYFSRLERCLMYHSCSQSACSPAATVFSPLNQAAYNNCGPD